MKGLKKFGVGFLKVKPKVLKFIVYGFVFISIFFVWGNDAFVNVVTIYFPDFITNTIPVLKTLNGNNAYIITFLYTICGIIYFVTLYISPKLNNIFISMLGVIICRKILEGIYLTKYSISILKFIIIEKLLSIEQKIALFQAEIDKICKNVDTDIINQLNFYDIYHLIEFSNNPDIVIEICHKYIMAQLNLLQPVEFGGAFINSDGPTLVFFSGFFTISLAVIGGALYFYYTGGIPEEYDIVMDVEAPEAAGPIVPAGEQPLQEFPEGLGFINPQRPFQLPQVVTPLDIAELTIVGLSSTVLSIFFFGTLDLISDGLRIEKYISDHNDDISNSGSEKLDIFEIGLLLPTWIQIISVLCFVIVPLSYLIAKTDFNIDKNIWLDR